MSNQRIYYANHAVTVASGVVPGVQSVSVNTNFNLEQVFQLGRLAIYENIAGDPDVEATITKALDGYPLVYVLASEGGLGGSLVENANQQVTIGLTIGNDTDRFLGENAGLTHIEMSGMFLSSLNYTFPVEGNFTEEVTFIGSSKSVTGNPASAPPALPGPNVLRRQNFKVNGSDLPSEVDGKNLSSVSISADLGREKMYKLGQFSPFHRFVNFPLEITVSFDVISNDHDNVAAQEVTGECIGQTTNVEQAISINLCDEDGNTVYSFDLGSKCTLQSVSYSGGDTGGGNVTTTYTYVTYNELDIQ